MVGLYTDVDLTRNKPTTEFAESFYDGISFLVPDVPTNLVFTWGTMKLLAIEGTWMSHTIGVGLLEDTPIAKGRGIYFEHKGFGGVGDMEGSVLEDGSLESFKGFGHVGSELDFSTFCFSFEGFEQRDSRFGEVGDIYMVEPA